MEKFESIYQVSPSESETGSPQEEKLSPEQEQLRSNKLQLAWAINRLPGENTEEKMMAAMEWLTTEEGMAVSDWFRREVMDFVDHDGQSSRKKVLLSRVSDSENMDVSPVLLKELDVLYETSLH